MQGIRLYTYCKDREELYGISFQFKYEDISVLATGCKTVISYQSAVWPSSLGYFVPLVQFTFSCKAERSYLRFFV